MKRKIRTPYFEIGTKNYVYGDTMLEYAIAADKAAEKYDIDVLFIAPAVEIRRIAENTKHLIKNSSHQIKKHLRSFLSYALPILSLIILFLIKNT